MLAFDGLGTAAADPFRLSEDTAFIAAMMHEFERHLFYEYVDFDFAQINRKLRKRRSRYRRGREAVRPRCRRMR